MCACVCVCLLLFALAKCLIVAAEGGCNVDLVAVLQEEKRREEREERYSICEYTRVHGMIHAQY